MSLPNSSDLNTLAWVANGQPFGTYQPSTADTTTLAFVSEGQPFYAQGAGSTPIVSTQFPVVFIVT